MIRGLNWTPVAVSAAVIALDRVTKLWIERSFDSWTVVHVIPGLFQLVHTRNTGIAFGMLQSEDGRGSMPLAIFSIAVMAFIAHMMWNAVKPGSKEHWTMRFGLALIFGGAAGNLHDRLRWGSVTDFLDFYWGIHHFPVFNVADSAITTGAGLLLLSLWLGSKVSAKTDEKK